MGFRSYASNITVPLNSDKHYDTVHEGPMYVHDNIPLYRKSKHTFCIIFPENFAFYEIMCKKCGKARQAVLTKGRRARYKYARAPRSGSSPGPEPFLGCIIIYRVYKLMPPHQAPKALCNWEFVFPIYCKRFLDPPLLGGGGGDFFFACPRTRCRRPFRQAPGDNIIRRRKDAICMRES